MRAESWLDDYCPLVSGKKVFIVDRLPVIVEFADALALVPALFESGHPNRGVSS